MIGCVSAGGKSSEGHRPAGPFHIRPMILPLMILSRHSPSDAAARREPFPGDEDKIIEGKIMNRSSGSDSVGRRVGVEHSMPNE